MSSKITLAEVKTSNTKITTETAENLDTIAALAYYGRLAFTLHLLPLLKASAHQGYHPRVVNLGGAGGEASSLKLDDLGLNKPGNYSTWYLFKYIATAMTLTLSRIAEENPDVVFVFNVPGLVTTGIHKGSWVDSWYGRILVALVGARVEDAGENCVFLLTSGRFGGSGVKVGEGEMRVKNMKGTEERGALFCVNDKLVGLQQEKVMRELERMDALRKVWERLMEVIGPHM
ncbi:hypothetical protein DL98DRAFT_439941 [Cadophora sp. DSE1049]|nr:hypothetical protein DL98DRAFT_439941 [Cadophora sp. DSE1049]